MSRRIRQARPLRDQLPPDVMRRDLSIVAGAAVVLLVIAGLATWLNPAPLPGLWP